MLSKERLAKVYQTMRWLPAYGWQRIVRSRPRARHLVITLADHFEPAYLPETPSEFAPLDEQERRLERWCREYPKIFSAWRDADGRPFRHTYFYPAEQYVPSQIERLAEHCHDGWGEIEIHLHHGTSAPDTPENTRRALAEFRDILVGQGCLSRWNGEGVARYAFVHGNWALANSNGGRFCGVDSEMAILAETGCYADFTYPSAPDPSQIGKINSIYECALPLAERTPQRRGRDLRRGRAPKTFPLIIEGALGLDFARRVKGVPAPKIENSELTAMHPPTLERLRLWQQATVTVKGQPDWLFIKLHCHGMNPDDETAMLGDSIQNFLRELTGWSQNGGGTSLHFVTAREMVNIILAACDGREGNPRDFINYKLQLIEPS